MSIIPRCVAQSTRISRRVLLGIFWYLSCSSPPQARADIRVGGFNTAGSVIAGASNEAGGTGVVVTTAVGKASCGNVPVAGANVSGAGAGAGRGVTGAEDGAEAGTGWSTLLTRIKFYKQNKTYHLQYLCSRF